MQYCETCKTDYPDEKKFCRQCGLPLIDKPVESAKALPASLKCASCGKGVTSGKKFCRHCGAAVDSAASAVVTQEAPREVKRQTAPSILEEPFKAAGSKVVPIEPQVSIHPAAETGEPAALTAAKQPHWLFLIGAVVIALVGCSIALWYFVASPEARISRAVDRGDLVTPVRESAYGIYQHSKPDLSVNARARLREKVLGKLLTSAESLVQKRTQGEGLSQSEVQQMTSLYDWAVDLAPGDARALAGQRYALGMSALLSGKPGAALPFLLESTNYNQNWAPAFNELGRAYVKLDDHYHAAEAYKRAISVDPNWVFPQINLGGVYLHDKQWDLAEQSYLKATQLDTTLATPWYFLGQVYEAERRKNQAIDAYEKAVELYQARPSSAFQVDPVRRRIERLSSRYPGTPIQPNQDQAPSGSATGQAPQLIPREEGSSAKPDTGAPTKVTGDGTKMPDGLQYWDIKVGTGATAQPHQTVKVHYTGWLTSGKKFDSSVDRGEPISFGLDQVIKGWGEGVPGMKIGGKRQLRIPPDLAYGPNGHPPVIPPNSTLIFDIELLGIE